jgi:hypothetical protein
VRAAPARPRIHVFDNSGPAMADAPADLALLRACAMGACKRMRAGNVTISWWASLELKRQSDSGVVGCSWHSGVVGLFSKNIGVRRSLYFRLGRCDFTRDSIPGEVG